MAHILAYESKNAEGRHILCTQCLDGFELMDIIKNVDPEDVIQCTMPFFIIRADRDLNILEEYNFKDVAYGGASVAYPFEDKIFIGAYKSDRIAIFKR